MDANKLAKTSQEFAKAKMMMDNQSEMTDDAFSSLFDDDEQEVDEAVEKVLDQIGIEVSDRMAGIPSAKLDSLSVADKDVEADIEAQLARLRDS